MDILGMLWGLKTVALFDFWSIEHMVSGISLFGLAGLASARVVPDDTPAQLKYHYGMVLVLLAAYVWESVEFYGEIGWWGAAAQRWFYGIEFWPNRIIIDPLLVLAGFGIAQKYPGLVWPARIFSVAWLVVHVFIFPHSMYLNEILI